MLFISGFCVSVSDVSAALQFFPQDVMIFFNKKTKQAKSEQP